MTKLSVCGICSYYKFVKINEYIRYCIFCPVRRENCLFHVVDFRFSNTKGNFPGGVIFHFLFILDSRKAKSLVSFGCQHNFHHICLQQSQQRVSLYSLKWYPPSPRLLQPPFTAALLKICLDCLIPP